jgi:hypothetical protein
MAAFLLVGAWLWLKVDPAEALIPENIADAAVADRVQPAVS